MFIPRRPCHGGNSVPSCNAITRGAVCIHHLAAFISTVHCHIGGWVLFSILAVGEFFIIIFRGNGKKNIYIFNFF